MSITEEHKTPWIEKWTLDRVEIDYDLAGEIAEKISKSLDKEHNWYADFKNNKNHFIIFRDRVFFIDRIKKEEYEKAREYGISLGIPDYQLDFSSNVLV